MQKFCVETDHRMKTSPPSCISQSKLTQHHKRKKYLSRKDILKIIRPSKYHTTTYKKIHNMHR